MLYQGEPRYKFDEGNPFISEEEVGEVASVAYRYRKWDLDNGVMLIARCEHDAVMHGPNGELQFVSIKALNEWDSKVCQSPFKFFVLAVAYFHVSRNVWGLRRVVDTEPIHYSC
jgi:hypothetical protein